MIKLVIAMFIVFLGPLVVADICITRQQKQLEREERKLRLMNKYGISDEDLKMPVRKRA